jgi:hypothetical protein
MTGKGAGALHQRLTRRGLASEPEAYVVSTSSLSFYNQNRNWQIQQQRWSDQFSATSNVTSVLSSALTNQSAGRAAISNHQALLRVTAQLKAAATSVANGLTPAQLAQLSTTSSSLKSTQKSSSSTASSLNVLA